VSERASERKREEECLLVFNDTRGHRERERVR
jgi:hypothetical protein